LLQHYRKTERGYEKIEAGPAMLTHRAPGRKCNTNPYYNDNVIRPGWHCQERSLNEKKTQKTIIFNNTCLS
jgi:hypothetical protein